MMTVRADAGAMFPDTVGIWVRTVLTMSYCAAPFRMLSTLSQHLLSGKHHHSFPKVP